MRALRVPRVGPVAAILIATTLHSVMTWLLFLLVEASNRQGGWAVTMFAVLVMVVPGIVAGYASSGWPFLVGLVGAVSVASAQLLAVHLLLHPVSWSSVAAGLVNDVMQGIVFCIMAIAAYYVRARLQPPSSRSVA
jgi:hypothetical protein